MSGFSLGYGFGLDRSMVSGGAPPPPVGYIYLTNKTGSMQLTNKDGSLKLLGKAA